MQNRPILSAFTISAYTILAVVAAAAVATAQTSPLSDSPPSERNFQVKSTGDLLKLCEAKPVDSTGIAALHFCQGFAVGAYQYHQIASAAEGKRPLFCPPNPPPSRNDAIAAFVTWGQQNPSALSLPPVEGLFRYLAQHFPCRA
ncbi:Rap1a/Tai family immunity protein [Azospirillum sp. CT11-132]|uniref:Rap1a/Tai family immunity protein n=1 Tax=Azospirillum sp. CT11-132 TaxID=3396317 RepID=UPI0039A61716